jgi:hypothetical protein
MANEKKKCTECKKLKTISTGFYASNSPLFPDGRVSLCKACVLKNVDVASVDSVKKMLRQIDKPFIEKEWQSCLDSGKEPFGWYLRKISGLMQHSKLGYEDGISDEHSVVDTKLYKYNNDMLTEDDIYDKPTIDVLRKWGTSFSNKEYYELENLWDEMDRANDISTPQHKKQLKNYCKVAVLIDRALEENDTKTFQLLNKEFDTIQKNSGFRPIDKKSGSESAGIRSFSTIFEEVERDGFIISDPLKFPQDIVDKTIIYMLNYQRKLFNMEQLIEVPEDAPYDDEGVE